MIVAILQLCCFVVSYVVEVMLLWYGCCYIAVVLLCC